MGCFPNHVPKYIGLESNDEITDMRKILKFRIPFCGFVLFRLDSGNVF